MIKINLKTLLLTFAAILFIQNGVILLPDLPEYIYSEEELISPQNDSPDHDTNIT